MEDVKAINPMEDIDSTNWSNTLIKDTFVSWHHQAHKEGVNNNNHNHTQLFTVSTTTTTNPLDKKYATLPTPPPDVLSSERIPRVILWNAELKQMLVDMHEKQGMSFQDIARTGKLPGSSASLQRFYKSICDSINDINHSIMPTTLFSKPTKSNNNSIAVPWSTEDIDTLVRARDTYNLSWDTIIKDFFPERTKHSVCAAYRRAKKKVGRPTDLKSDVNAFLSTLPPALDQDFAMEMWSTYHEDKSQLLRLMKRGFLTHQFHKDDGNLKWLMEELAKSH